MVKRRTLRLYYDRDFLPEEERDFPFIDIDVTHCVENHGKFDPNKIVECVAFWTEEEQEEWDKKGY